MSLLNANATDSNELNENYEIHDFDYGLNGSANRKSKHGFTYYSQDQEDTEIVLDKYSTIKDERLIQMIVIIEFVENLKLTKKLTKFLFIFFQVFHFIEFGLMHGNAQPF